VASSGSTHFPGQTGFVPAAEAQIRHAATVMLLRESPRGPEVFMMKRTSRIDFGGLHVFPGGKVNPEDAHGEMARHCAGLSDDEASTRLGVGAEGLAYWVAAIRECFEESGVLLAYGPDGEILRAAKARWAEGLARLRDELNAGTRTFLDVCRATDMQLATDRVAYFSHWITPEGPPRRYDTRFFVAAAPEAQQGLHDDGELVDSLWMRPADALDARRRGEIDMIYPTFTTLEALADWDDVPSLLAAVVRGEHRERVTPDERLAREGLQPPPG
jgi:8-oxo-dGTP pyrophosphatase MutT (NUDIX family)